MINILFFGLIADKMGKKSMHIQAGLCLKTMIKQTGCDCFKPLLIAVNQVQVHDMAYVLQEGDEVAIMPPFSGG